MDFYQAAYSIEDIELCLIVRNNETEESIQEAINVKALEIIQSQVEPSHTLLDKATLFENRFQDDVNEYLGDPDNYLRTKIDVIQEKLKEYGYNDSVVDRMHDFEPLNKNGHTIRSFAEHGSELTKAGKRIVKVAKNYRNKPSDWQL
jgi:hypothetical protein